MCGWVEEGEGDACLQGGDPHKGGVVQGGGVHADPIRLENSDCAHC